MNETIFFIKHILMINYVASNVVYYFIYDAVRISQGYIYVFMYALNT